MIILIGIYIIVLLLLFILMPESWQMYWDPPRYDFNKQLIQKTEARIFGIFLKFC